MRQDERKRRQHERGREVYIIEEDGVPEVSRRHAYMSRPIAKSAASTFRGGHVSVTRYVPAELLRVAWDAAWRAHADGEPRSSNPYPEEEE